MESQTGAIWPLLVVFPAFALLWVTITYVISCSGWRRFSSRETSDVRIPVDAKPHRFQTLFIGGGRFRNASYKGCMNYYIDQSGLFLRPIFMVRLFHPALHIRWSDIKSISTQKVFIARWRNIDFVDDLPSITIPGRTGRLIHETWCKYTKRPFHED